MSHQAHPQLTLGGVGGWSLSSLHSTLHLRHPQPPPVPLATTNCMFLITIATGGHGKVRWPFGTTSPSMHQAQGARLTLRLEILADARAPGRIQDEQRARGWSRSSCLPGWVARNLADLSGLACPRHPPYRSNMAASARTGPARQEPGPRSGAGVCSRHSSRV